ncbi:MAG TPA: hypothetical protein VKT77_20880 [Chthonomonadaceae bacterium]|nr:hypothetical protein [Chthonomonadaceae bacterium]
MHIASPDGRRRLPRAERAQLRSAWLALSCGALLCSCAATAQLNAKLQDKKNIVKYSRDDRSFVDAPLQQTLNRGDELVTGLRSMAGVLFTDQSYLRVNESTKVVISAGARQRDVSVPQKNGAAYGKYNGPGRIIGVQALCAVRGTEFDFHTEAHRDVVRCFGPQGHQVFVTAAKNALITGRVTTPGAAQLASDDLIGNAENWIGGRLQFVTGGQAQARTVTAFDPATGTITLNAPLPNGANAGLWFYIINPPGARVVVLEKNMETYVGLNGEPADPYATEPKEFAGGEQFPFMMDKLHGDSQTNLSGFFYERQRHSTYELDNARNSSQNYSDEAPGIQILSGTDQRGTNHQNGTGDLGVGVGSTNQPGTGNVGVGIGNGNPNSTGGLNVSIGPGRAAIFGRVPEFGGVGFTTSRSDTAFAYASDSAVVGSVYVRAGGRIGTLERSTNNQLDELLLRYRNRHIGDVQVGRFHWLPGPVSNGLLGTLISFTSADGILWDLPETGAYTVQVGWLDKINPLSRPNVGGYTARIAMPVRTGLIAVTALATAQKTIGATGDFEYPILPQRLEVYGESGVDTDHQTVYAAGLYFPQIFHKFHADLAIELAYRGHFGHSVDLALHTPITRYADALITLSKPGAARWQPGIGLQAHY